MSAPLPWPQRRELLTELAAAKQAEREGHRRWVSALLAARDAGLDNVCIAHQVGLSEAAIRQQIKRLERATLA